MQQVGTHWNETIAKFVIGKYTRPFEAVFNCFPKSDLIHQLSEDMLRCTEPGAELIDPFSILSQMPDESFHLICFDAMPLLQMDRSDQSIVLEQAARTLSPGGYCCFMISDEVRYGKIVPHGFQLVHRFLASGFKVESIYDHNSNHVLPFKLVPHQYLAVFQKPAVRKKLTGTASFTGARRPRIGIL